MSSLSFIGIILGIGSFLGGYIMRLFTSSKIQRQEELLQAKDQQIKSIKEDAQFADEIRKATLEAAIKGKKEETEILTQIDDTGEVDYFNRNKF